MSEIERYLQEQTHQGQKDSVGVFTIALEKARQKLSQYQLADPSFYLLKVFQAAVHAGTSEVQIKLSRSSVRLWFETPHRAYPMTDTLRALDDALGVKAQGLRHLVLGLNASLVLDPVGVSWTEWAPEGEQALAIVEGELHVVAAGKKPQKKFPREGYSGYLLQLDKAPPSLLGPSASAAEHTAVSQRCGYAPLNVVLDGKRLSGAWKTTACPPWLDELSQPFYLGERFVTDPGGPVSTPARSLNHYLDTPGCWLKKGSGKATFCLQFVDTDHVAQRPTPGQPIRCRGAYAIPLALEGGNSVTLIKDGVLLESVWTVPDRFADAGAVAIVDGSHLNVDMSEFKVIKDDAYWETLARVEDQWGLLASACLKHLDQLKRAKAETESKANQNKRYQGYTCGCLSGCLVPMVLGVILPITTIQPYFGAAALAGVVGGLGMPWLLEPPPNRDVQLQQEIAPRLKRALENWESA